MARYHPIKNSFVAGELSPRLEGRDDLDQYFQGMRQALNGIVLPHGGFMRRSGTRFVAEVKDSTKTTIPIPFQFSTEQAYVCEFGEQYIRFYANEGRVESGGVPVEVVTPYLESELRDLQWVQEADVMWVVHPKHPPFKLARTSATSFTFTEVTWREGRAPMRPQNVDTSLTVTVTGAGPYTLTWSASMGFSANWPQDYHRGVWIKNGANVGWYKITGVTSDTVVTATLEGGTATTSSATSEWALGASSGSEGFYAVALHEGRLVYGGTPNHPDRLWFSVSDQFNDFEFEPASEDDKSFSLRLVSGQVNTLRWLASVNEVLVAGTSGGEFRVTSDNTVLTPTSAYPKPASSRGSTHTLPVVVDTDVVFVQRDGETLRQMTYDLTRDGQVARHMSILAEHILEGGADRITYRQHPDSVIWCRRKDGVLVGFTFEAEQKVIGAHRHIVGGSFGTGHAEVEGIAVIPSPTGLEDQLWLIVKRTINGATKRYVEFMEEPYDPDVTVRSTDEERITALDEAYFVDCGLTLDDPKTISGITQADPAVVTATGHGFLAGDRVKIRGVEGMTEVNNLVYLVANPTANTFELTDLDGNNIDSTGFEAYVSGGTVRKEVLTVSGLSHLEGETVDIMADGSWHPQKTVSGGSVTLDRYASIIHVGLHYDTEGETQRWIGGNPLGTDQGKKQRVVSAVLRLHNTLGGRVGVGPQPATLAKMEMRSSSDPLDRPPPLFSGDWEVALSGGHTREPTIYFKQDLPYPFTVLAIMPVCETGAG